MARMSPTPAAIADFVALQEFQMDPSLLPNELLRTCEAASMFRAVRTLSVYFSVKSREELAMLQLMPDTNIAPQDQ